MAIYVTDTHPLIWYSSGAYRKLSPKARRLFDRASHSEVLIWTPAMAVWEAGLLEKIGRVRFKPSFKHWIDALIAQPSFVFAPIDLDLITSLLEIVPHADLSTPASLPRLAKKAPRSSPKTISLPERPPARFSGRW